MTNEQIFEMACRAGLLGKNPDIKDPLIAKALPELAKYTEMATAHYVEALRRAYAVMRMTERAYTAQVSDLITARQAISRCISS